MQSTLVCEQPQIHQTDMLASIADALATDGYIVLKNGLPQDVADALSGYVTGLQSSAFHDAGTGRQRQANQNPFVRKDEICWIDGHSDAGRLWLDWADGLMQYLNRTLFMGLFSFESHFAHYRAGDFYKKHLDAFKGRSNRVLSVVTYLNPDWQAQDGGELVIYSPEKDGETVNVLPEYATVVIFLSEKFPHEVLPATRDRYSVAGWFRINGTSADYLDPAH